MIYHNLKTLLCHILALFSVLLPMAANADLILPKPIQTSDNTWAWVGPYGPPSKENQGFRMNLGFIVGKDSVAVIDSGYGGSMAEAMISHISQITDRPVAYVINTNSQPHRILGNAAFRKEGAKILASEDAAPRIVGEGETMASSAEGILGIANGSIQPPGAPDRTLHEITQLNLGGVTLNVVPVGTAHTDGSIIVEVVEDKVIFAGDVLYGGRLLAVLPVSRVDGWIAAFEKLKVYDNALFVPGHGEPGKLSDFETSTYEYLVNLKNHMDEAIDQGVDLQEAISTLDQSKWQNLEDFEALAGRNAHQCYIEREAASFE